MPNRKDILTGKKPTLRLGRIIKKGTRRLIHRRDSKNGGKKNSHIVHTFLIMLNTVKLYHWKTTSYATHKATDDLYAKIGDLIDHFVEVMLGKEELGGRAKILKGATGKDDYLLNLSLYSSNTEFKKQIEYVQRCSRNAAIIVIGPSDMAQYKEGIYSTYKFLPYCVQQMKKQSLIAGASYWDLYDAMGGKNSMFAWVNNGLAGKDYVHFSNKGASKASQLFYNAFISTYKQWEYNNLSINNKADDNPE